MSTFAAYGIEVPPGARGEIKVRCPKCAHTRKPQHQREKDLSVNVEKGKFKCWHCDFAGGLEDGITPRERYVSPTPLVTVRTDQERMYAWFAARGIDRDVVDRNGVTTHTTNRGVAIAFPHYRDGVHVHTAFRLLGREKKCWQDKGTERIFWGLDDDPEATQVLICEGHPDKLAWNMAVDLPVWSVPDGAGVGDGKMTYLTSAADRLERMERVYLAMDADKDGQAALHELARRIGISKCWIVTYPEGCKDANEVLLSEGAVSSLSACLHNSKPYPVDGIYTVSSTRSAVDEYLAFGADEGVRIGLPHLDRLYRPRLGTVTVLTGISGHGKSEWLDQIMVRIARAHDWAFAIFSPENMPVHEHAVELAEILLHKRHEQFGEHELDLVWDFLDDHFVYILPESYTIDAILERMRVAVLRHGVRGCVLDPWNMIESERPKDITETEYVSVVMTKLTKFAQQNGVHVWLVAHPAKYDNYSAREKEPKPNLNDIASSGNFRNKCDYGVVIWRDIYDAREPAQVLVQKVRHRSTGTTGHCFYRLDPQTRTLEEVEDPRRLTVMARSAS